MHQSLPMSSRRPALPSDGGLLARDFVYRTAEKTDVRLTWERARARQGSVAGTLSVFGPLPGAPSRPANP
jgi:hypothetical protein